MKATPPPPPVVPPTESPTLPVGAPPADPPAPPAGVKRASVPEWFRALDATTAVLAVAAAFLAAAFPARNSDLFLTLAGGRLIAGGDWHLAADPFGFTGRAWVHTTWLADLLFYGLYKLDPAGAVLVGVKAALFAAGFALLGLLRKPGQSLWPWAVFGVAGAVAACPYAAARPAVLSVPLLAALLVLLGRLPLRAGWRDPVIVAGLVAVWANVDALFVLGPLTVALTLAGALLDRAVRPPAEGAEPGPAVPVLVKTLALCVVASVLNPYFLAAVAKDPAGAVVQLVPIETGVGLPPAADDPAGRALVEEAFATRVIGPLNPAYWARDAYTINGVALGLLAVAGGLGLGLGFGRVSGAAVVVWVGFLAVGVLHVRLIPYFAVVAAAVGAAQANALAARVRLGPAADPNTRVVLTAAALGRILSVGGAFALVLAAYPGWLHAVPADPARANRVVWRLDAAEAFVKAIDPIEPDAGLERAAVAVQALYDAGTLPARGRAANAGTEYGNYAAWFAPAERTLMDGRFAFRRPDFADFLTVRLGLVTGGRQTREEFNRNLSDAAQRTADLAATHVVVAGPRAVEIGPALTLTTRPAEWGLVHLDGRSVVVGRGAVPADRQFDLVRLAFGPGPGLPVGPADPAPPASAGFWDDYARRARLPSPAADDLRAYTEYGQYAARAARQAAADRVQAGLAGLTGPQSLLFNGYRPPPPDAELAAGLVAVRAARRAVASAPDRPDGYVALAEAYDHPGAPVLDAGTGLFGGMTDRQMQRTAALRRALDRTPPPGKLTGLDGASAAVRAFALADLYRATDQLDAAKDALTLATDYGTRLDPAEYALVAAQILRRAPGGKPGDVLKEFNKMTDDALDALLGTLRAGEEALRRAPTADDKLAVAVQARMPLAALAVIADPGPAGFKADARAVRLQRAVIELRAGRVEAAVAGLGELPTTGPADPLGPLLAAAQGTAARLVGDYPTALAVLPRADFGRVVWDPAAARLAPALTPLSAAAGPTVLTLFASPQAETDVALVRAVITAEKNRATLLEQSQYHLDRGLLALTDGDVATARFDFGIAAAPQNVPVGSLVPVAAGLPPDPAALARSARVAQYMRLLDRAAK